MSKLPVGQTIAEAYRFTFVGFERVIGVAWLPIIILIVADYFGRGHFLMAMSAAMDRGDTSQLGPAIVGMLGFVILELVAQSVIGIAICREILRPLDRPLFLRFGLGGAELRMTGAVMGLVMLLVFVLVALILVGTIIIGMMAGGMGKGPAAAQAGVGAAMLVGLVLSPVLIYGVVRLGALVAPAVAMEGGLGLERSWLLLKGSVWRMVVVCLAAIIPVVLISVIGQTLIMGPGAVAPHFGADQAEQMRQTAEVYRQTAANLPMLEGLAFVLAPFLYGLSFSAPAFAYNALTKNAQTVGSRPELS